jgi:autotransporter-associated beta strand protein
MKIHATHAQIPQGLCAVFAHYIHSAKGLIMRNFKLALLAATALPASIVAAQAASDTLKTTPADNNYNNTANWVGGSVPASGQTATFNNVNADGVNLSPIYFSKFTADTTVGTFQFLAPGTKHIILLDGGLDLTFTGGSGVLVGNAPSLPAFDVAAGSILTFNNGTASSTPANERVSYSISGDLIFNTGTNAGNADLQVGTNTGTATFNGSASASTALILNNNIVNFNGTSTAGSSAITNNMTLTFNNSSTAGSATINSTGSIFFEDTSTAGESTITLINDGDIDFNDDSEGGTARLILGGGAGAHDVFFTGQTGGAGSTVTIGSIEGGNSADSIYIDAVTRVRIGSNNFSATNGVVTLNALLTTGGAGSGLDKIGTGELVLANNSNNFLGTVGLYGGKLTISGNGALGNAANAVNFFGGTLRTTSTFTSNRTFTLDAGGGTFETNALTSLTVTTAIGEAGSARTLTKTGGGDLFLTAGNTYTGGTNINAGRILLGVGGATGEFAATGNVVIASNASLVFNRSDAALNMGNAISGAGNVIKFETGTVTLSGTNTYSGVTFVSDGRLIAAGGSAIGDASDVTVNGPGILQLLASETVGSLGGDMGVVNIGAFDLTLGGGSSSFVEWVGDIQGTGNVIKNGSYTQVFDVSQSYTGDTTVNAGVLRVNGTLEGSVFVNQPGTFGGNATVFGNVTNNNGNVAPGNSPGVLSMLGDYIGVGAPTYTVDILAQSQGATNIAGTTHDLIQIGDDYVGASTQLLLNPTGTPVATVGNGIEIARINNSSDADDFFLATNVQSAANGFYQGFQYVVNYVDGGGGQDRFFLQTQVREELVANATALAASRQLTRDCFRGSVSPAAGGKGGEGRGWLNAKVGSFNSDASNGADFDTNYNCVNGGFDVPVGSNVSVGIRGGYANSDLDLSVPQGLAQMDALTFNVEAAVTYISGAFYAGLSGGWTAHDWDYDHALASGNTSSESFDGFTGSLFAGYRAGMGKDTSLTLEGLVSYDGTDCDSNCFLVGTQEDISEWEGRLLGRIDTKIGGVMPYFQASVSSDFGDGQTISFGNAVSNVDIASLLIGANVGVSANLGGNWTGVFDLGTTQGADSDVDGYHGSIGVKTTW